MLNTISIRDGGKWQRLELCCEALGRAFQVGTDAEGYGSLVGVAYDGSNKWQFKSDVIKPSFCPWCGAPNAVKRSE